MANGELQPRFVLRDLRDAELLIALVHEREHEVGKAVLETRIILASTRAAGYDPDMIGLHLQIGDKMADGTNDVLTLLAEELAYVKDMQAALQVEITRLRTQDEMATRRENG